MRIRSWGAIIDSERDIWIPVLYSSILIRRKGLEAFKYVGKLNSDNNAGRCIIKVLETNRNLFLFSRLNCVVFIVSKETQEISCIKLIDVENVVVLDVVRADKYAVILTSISSSPVLMMNLYSFELESITAYGRLCSDNTMFVRGVYDKGFVYTATRHLDDVRICRVDISNKTVDYIKTDLRMVNAVCSEEGSNWLFGLTKDNRSVLRQYTADFGEYNNEYELRDIDGVMENGVMKYFRIEYCAEKMYFFPSLAKKIYVYDTKSQLGKFLEYPEGVKDIKSVSRFGETQRIGTRVVLFPFEFQQILELDLELCKIELLDLDVDIITKRMIMEDCINSSDCIDEGDVIELSEFVEIISN